MKNLSRSIASPPIAAMMLFVIGAAQRAGAQTAPGQASADKPPATTFNPAIDKLDRTQAGPITRPMIVEIAYQA